MLTAIKKTGRALSTDYGLMQVNSSHIPALMAQGVIRSPQDLLTRPCLNVQIGTGFWRNIFRYAVSAGTVWVLTTPGFVRIAMKRANPTLTGFMPFTGAFY